MPEQTIDLAAIEARFANATGGRWVGYRRRTGATAELFGITAHDHPAPGDSIDIVEAEGVRPEDVEFLAHARADIFALLGELHRVRVDRDFTAIENRGLLAELLEIGPGMPSLPALYSVLNERARQDAKWGEQNHPNGTGPRRTPLDRIDAQLDEPLEYETAQHLANAAKEATDIHAKRGTVTWTDILLEEVFEALAENDPAKLRAELVQVAAVAVQWAEAIDRRTNTAALAEEVPDA